MAVRARRARSRPEQTRSLSAMIDGRAPLIAALVAAVVTLAGLARPSITLVETATLTAAGRPLGSFPNLLNHTDAVLSPYYVFMHFWLIASHTLWWIRLPGVLASAAAAALVVLITRRFAPRAALAAGVLTAIAPAVSRYAEDARPYSFAIAFAALATWRLLIARERRTRGAWAWYGLSVVLLGASHLFGLLLLPAHAWLVRRTPRSWFVSVVAAGAVLSPLAVMGARQVSRELSWASRPGLHVARAFVGELTGSSVLTVVFGVLALAGAISLWRGWASPATNDVFGRDAAVLLCAWLFFPPVVLFAVAQAHAVFAQRYLVFTVPALTILVAVGIVGLADRFSERVSSGTVAAPAVAVAAVAVAVVAVGALTVPPHVNMRGTAGHDGNDLRAIVRLLAQDARPGDGIVMEPDSARRVYFGFAKMPAGRLLLLNVPPAESGTLSGTNVDMKTFRERASQASRIWVVTVIDDSVGDAIYARANSIVDTLPAVKRVEVTGGSVVLHSSTDGGSLG